MTLELATGTPFNRSEFKDIQMKHQDILVSKLEAIAFYKLVINNVKDLVQPFYLTALAHAQHIQSEVKAIKSPFWTKVIGKIYGINLPMLVDTGATISIALGSMVALLTAKPRRIESAAMGASGQMIQFKSEATVSSFGRVNSPLVALVWFGQWQNEVLQA
ncbi:hypothetical protein QR680_014619 [Steinernema hermaphroditum]|uniref:Uncharacterized protein n=1 Tax=Steinernema hermaphroditum TaxID=289476 RepID=A0AA39IB09_9BILA|nr:hypothetical protein QR680_014619 [Steinernema hermaphroditum]